MKLSSKNKSITKAQENEPQHDSYDPRYANTFIKRGYTMTLKGRFLQFIRAYGQARSARLTQKQVAEISDVLFDRVMEEIDVEIHNVKAAFVC